MRKVVNFEVEDFDPRDLEWAPFAHAYAVSGGEARMVKYICPKCGNEERRIWFSPDAPVLLECYDCGSTLLFE